MEFDGLRFILLLLGIAVVAGVYIWSRFRPDQEATPAERIEPAIGGFGPTSTARSPVTRRAEPSFVAPQQAVAEGDDESVPTLFDEIFRPPEPGMPADVIIVNVFAADGHQFEGVDLQEGLKECGMEYGAMRIYHRMNDGGDRLFSLVNSVEPGYFEQPDLADFSTPGVSLFLALPGPQRPAAALEELIATAQTLSRHLEGRLLDADRNPLRTQGIEHLRERVREFERRSRIARAGKPSN